MAACSKPEDSEQRQEASSDNRAIGPTDNDFFVAQSTDGRKAELKFTDRKPDGTLVAYSRNGKRFEFPENRLTQESIEKLHEYKTQDAMVNLRLQELRSHTSHYNRTQSANATSGRASINNNPYSITSSDGANASHQVIITTTSPFERQVSVESFYTDNNGYRKIARSNTEHTISNAAPLELTISGSANYSVLQPVVIVRDSSGKTLDFETKNIKYQNELNAMR